MTSLSEAHVMVMFKKHPYGSIPTNTAHILPFSLTGADTQKKVCVVFPRYQAI